MHQEHNCSQDNDSEQIAAIIEKYGCYVALFESTAYLPSFAYTIGLLKSFNHPELICFGLPLETMHSALNEGANAIDQGASLISNIDYDIFFEGTKACLIPVHKLSLNDYFGYAQEFYGYMNLKALQVIWPDPKGHYPWGKEFDQSLKDYQPLLDRNFGFKFKEVENLGVFTSRFITELNKKITYVLHDEDGDWQFLSDDEVTDDDMRLVHLKHMVDKDESLNDLFNLEYGEAAQRTTDSHKWTRSINEA